MVLLPGTRCSWHCTCCALSSFSILSAVASAPARPSKYVSAPSTAAFRATLLAWWFSSKLGLLPFYVLLLFFLWRFHGWRNTALLLLGVALTITLTDQISVHLFKEVFQRYRPSHHLELSKLLHFYEPISGQPYKGGQYGFISSHAANFFGMFGFLYVSISKRNWIKISVFCLGLAVIWSRVYLGVHYPSDVVVGAIVGLSIGDVIWKLMVFLKLN